MVSATFTALFFPHYSFNKSKAIFKDKLHGFQITPIPSILEYFKYKQNQATINSRYKTHLLYYECGKLFTWWKLQTCCCLYYCPSCQTWRYQTYFKMWKGEVHQQIIPSLFVLLWWLMWRQKQSQTSLTYLQTECRQERLQEHLSKVWSHWFLLDTEKTTRARKGTFQVHLNVNTVTVLYCQQYDRMLQYKKNYFYSGISFLIITKRSCW